MRCSRTHEGRLRAPRAAGISGQYSWGAVPWQSCRKRYAFHGSAAAHRFCRPLLNALVRGSTSVATRVLDRLAEPLADVEAMRPLACLVQADIHGAAAAAATPSARRPRLYAAVKLLSKATGVVDAPPVVASATSANGDAAPAVPGKRPKVRENLKKKARKAALRKRRYDGFQKKKWHPRNT